MSWFKNPLDFAEGLLDQVDKRVSSVVGPSSQDGDSEGVTGTTVRPGMSRSACVCAVVLHLSWLLTNTSVASITHAAVLFPCLATSSFSGTGCAAECTSGGTGLRYRPLDGAEGIVSVVSAKRRGLQTRRSLMWFTANVTASPKSAERYNANIDR